MPYVAIAIGRSGGLPGILLVGEIAGEQLGKLVGAPYVPFTPYLLPLPLPVRLDVVYGEPMEFEGEGDENDEIIVGYVEQVRQRIADLIEEGRSIRREKRAQEAT